MNIHFTEQQQNYISTQLLNGDFKNATDVVQDALQLHQFYRNRVLADLRIDIDKGWDSPISTRSLRDIIESKIKNNK